MYAKTNRDRRTRLATNRWHDSRVQFRAYLPSLIHCSAVRVPGGVPRVHVRARIHENPNEVGRIAPDGFEEGVAAAVGRIHVRTCIDENPHDVAMVAPDRFKEEGIAAAVGRIHVRTCIDENPRNLAMVAPDRFTEEGVAAAVGRVHVRTCIDENPRNVGMVVPDGFVENGVAFGIPGVHICAGSDEHLQNVDIEAAASPCRLEEKWGASSVRCTCVGPLAQKPLHGLVIAGGDRSAQVRMIGSRVVVALADLVPNAAVASRQHQQEQDSGCERESHTPSQSVFGRGPFKLDTSALPTIRARWQFRRPTYLELSY